MTGILLVDIRLHLFSIFCSPNALVCHYQIARGDYYLEILQVNGSYVSGFHIREESLKMFVKLSMVGIFIQQKLANAMIVHSLFCWGGGKDQLVNT